MMALSSSKVKNWKNVSGDFSHKFAKAKITFIYLFHTFCLTFNSYESCSIFHRFELSVISFFTYANRLLLMQIPVYVFSFS